MCLRHPIALLTLAFVLCVASPAGPDEVVACSALFGDLNGDYVVDRTDFLILADQFGQECGGESDGEDCPHLVADLNADNRVGLLDVFLLSDQFSLTCDPEAALAEFDELQVRYLIADMQLGGPAGNVRLNTQDPNSVEAVRRWNEGERVSNIFEFERKIVGDRGLLVVYLGTDFRARGFDMVLPGFPLDFSRTLIKLPEEEEVVEIVRELTSDDVLAYSSERDGSATFPPSSHIHAIALGASPAQTNLTRSHERQNPFFNDDAPVWSADGSRIAYQSTNRDPLSLRVTWDIFIMNADGSAPIDLTPERTLTDDRWPTWSPDGDRIAFVARPFLVPAPPFNPGDILVINADGSEEVNLTQSQNIDEVGPVWSPDGSVIAFYQLPEFDIYTIRDDGSDVRNISQVSGVRGVPSWSPDGSTLAVTTGSALYVMDAGGGNAQLLVAEEEVSGRATWSPDGTWIAFQQTEVGPIEIIDLTDLTRRIIAVEDGWAPSWQPR